MDSSGFGNVFSIEMSFKIVIKMMRNENKKLVIFETRTV